MKKILYFAAALAASAFVASCEKPLQELNPTFPGSTDQTVTIASGETAKVEFKLNDVRGNVITVKAECLMTEDYKITPIVNPDNETGTIMITAPALILDDSSFDIKLSFEDKQNGRLATSKITVKPTVVSGLVKIDAAANTYVVAPGSVVVFPTMKGNSSDRAGAASVKLLWQDVQGLFVDVPQVNYDSAVVRFAEGKEGNAVLCGLDESNKVVWSWLFWVIKDAPKDVKVGEFTFMDRNIGAMNLDEKSELSVGLAYQYGRKDAFPSLKFTEYKLKPVYNEKGEEVAITIVNNTEEDNLANAIANPAIYYNNKYVSGAKHNYSWVTTDATKYGVEKFQALWANGGKKSMYDPCPAGYKVASVAAWEGVKAASASSTTELWDNSYETFDASAIGTNEKYAAGNRKKVQFRGCVYSNLRLTITGEINSNSTAFSFANCVGKALPTAEVWCADIDPNFVTNPSTVSYFRGTAVKVNTTGNGNYDDISAIKVNALSTAGRYGLNYALPVRCVKE